MQTDACAALLLVGAALLPQYLDFQQTQPQPGHTQTVSRFTEVSCLAVLRKALGVYEDCLQGGPKKVLRTLIRLNLFPAFCG